MSKHTPTPWKASDRWGNFGDHNRHEPDAPTGQVSRFSYSVADEDGFVVAHCTGPLVTMDSERSEANAEFIVRACNAHDELLEALRQLHSDVVSLVEYIEECENDGGNSYDTSKTRKLLGVAHTAIAKAENGGTPCSG